MTEGSKPVEERLPKCPKCGSTRNPYVECGSCEFETRRIEKFIPQLTTLMEENRRLREERDNESIVRASQFNRAETAEADLRKFVDKAMELGLDPADNGSGWHNERAESAESKLEKMREALRERPMWLVWSCEYELWWRANRCGYTANIAEAGRYTLPEAMKCCNTRSARSDRKPNEIVQPSPELLCLWAALSE